MNPAEGGTARSEIVATPVALKNPNQYVVQIVIGGRVINSSFSLYRVDKTGTIYKVANLDAKSCEFTDTSVRAGERYRYLVAGGSEDKAEIKAVTAVTVPHDVVVDANSHLEEIHDVARVFLGKDSVFSTNGNDVVIDAKEIVSDDGGIQTFPENAKAGLSQPGRSGGKLTITAKRGRGRLRILARGESGGDGRDGANGVGGTPGQSGQAGDWGMNPETYRYLRQNFVDSFGTMMRGYPKPPDDPEWGRGVGSYPFYICARHPSDGTPGGNGSAAKDGGMGGNGGDSAEVYVAVKENSPLSIEVISDPGLPGIGGRGGKGGPGGVGGPPGLLDQGHRCPAAKAGPNGVSGFDGRQGVPGAIGTKKPVCVRVGEKSFYACDQFRNEGR